MSIYLGPFSDNEDFDNLIWGEKQRKIEENEMADILSFNKRKQRMKFVIMNVIIPVFVVVTILIVGMVVFTGPKKETFEKKTVKGDSAVTMQLQETPKEGTPTITRSE